MRQPKPYFKKSHDAWYVNLNGKPERLAKGLKNEKAAWKKYHELMAGREEVGQDPTVLKVFQAFRAWSKRNHKPDTQEFYYVYQKSFLRAVGKRMKVSELKPLHLTRWVDKHWPAQDVARRGKVVQERASSSTRNGAIRAIKRAFNWAEEQGIIGRTPLKRVKAPKPTRRETYLRPEQYDELLGQIKSPAFHDVVQTLRHTGCRPQELRLVEARWFNRQERCWIFPEDESLPPKLQGRVVHLDETAFAISDRLAGENPEGPMFRSDRMNRPWTARAFVERCRKLRSKLDFHVTAYTIRHTFATDAIIKDVDLVTISQLMGHVDLRMLSEIYQHVRKRSDHLKKGLGKANQDLNGNGQSKSSSRSRSPASSSSSED